MAYSSGNYQGTPATGFYGFYVNNTTVQEDCINVTSSLSGSNCLTVNSTYSAASAASMPATPPPAYPSMPHPRAVSRSTPPVGEAV
jgi:hypothetical protein